MLMIQSFLKHAWDLATEILGLEPRLAGTLGYLDLAL